MKSIVVVGGIDANSSLASIELELIRLSGKKNPKLIHLPTASGDDTRNYKLVKHIFETDHNCEVDVLFLAKEEPTEEEIKLKVFSSDIIYIGGGPVSTLIEYFSKHNMSKILREAYEEGTVLSGVSAGAISFGTDYLDIDSQNKKSIIRCMEFLPFTFCPHYNKDSFHDYTIEFKDRIRNSRQVGIGLDNNCAIEFVDGKYRVVSALNNANAYRIYNKDSRLIKEIIIKDLAFRDISELL